MKKAKDIGRVLGLLFFAIIFAVSMVGQASAATNVFEYEVEFSGGTAPQGTSPWLTATFDDNTGNANSVLLTMSAGNLEGTEFVNDWYFNFDAALDPTFLTFNFVSGTAFAADNELTGINSFQANGDGNYDILFDYTESTTGDRFTSGETATYEITYTLGAIAVTSFDFFSYEVGGQGSYLAAAKVQGINGDDDLSGFVGVVPEPVSSTLFLVGAATLGFRRFRKMRKAA
jgi:hypothetical protein